ncbi:5-formyltetrahydrofolate cyclo-ligase [Paragemmobacter straminiformis]|uniref:5-formyltetrahydrofolate cyclo-ligase n=1 Tax=Paragemmobacter straminiformis TaxID=2045119 RepID=A0A842IC40_9RHOB|nr:5-formyltetrahydrofolate cyclo-ligase [Gemmobacter straminiformis]MBC2836917.1 5-formyltetrahydrofolate cyclo-ligase [Gemmobacter straminiformis]
MTLSSDPCQADHIGERPFAGDATSAADVSAWRQAERRRLRQERAGLTPSMLQNISERIIATLQDLLAPFDPATLTIGASWPVRGEPDPLPLLAHLRSQGATLGLSVCVDPPEAMRYRLWTAGTPLEPGLWNLPVPPAPSGEIRPNLVLVPLLGWDGDGHRLGFGTGYVDRTLARSPQVYAIGFGLQSARLSTIHPLPHDRALDLVVTECGIEAGRRPAPSGLGPVRDPH